MHACAVATLSTTNLLSNLAVIRKKAFNAQIVAMIKANAYGHGIRSVAQRLAPHVALFGVATWEEALILRHLNLTTPILVMRGATQAQHIIRAGPLGIQLVFHTEDQLQWLEHSILHTPLCAWLKVDTGMGRLGFSPKTALLAYNRLKNNKYVMKPLRILSHLACADTKHHPLNSHQIDIFEKLTHTLEGKFSLCNSAGIFNFEHCHYDIVRPGLALYGVSPIENISAQDLGLKPVLSLHSKLISVKHVLRGQTLGYGATYTCSENMLVGIVGLGYGDGYPSSILPGTPTLIHTSLCHIVGRVSMDMFAVDLRQCPQAVVGDCVLLWGEGLPIETIAHFTQRTPYDLLAGIQNRVKFIWK